MIISDVLSVILLQQPSFLGRLLRPENNNKNVLKCFLHRAPIMLGELKMVWGGVFVVKYLKEEQI